MGLFTNPLGYAGYPPGVTGTPETQPSAVRAATAAEAVAGLLDSCYLSPATGASSSAANFASPPVLGFGSTTPRPVHATTLSTAGLTTIGDGDNIAVGSTTGTKIGTATSQKLGWYNATPVVQQTQVAITNSVTSGGTTGTTANYTDLTVYANDSSAIRNDIYQLALALEGCIAALRTYGLLG
jgi:hypothetical protein